MANLNERDMGPTPVSIYGRTYNLRGEADAEHLAELAALVDGTMREVAQSTGTADTLKVAIMAALNIADDYLQARRGLPTGRDGEIDKRLARMVTLLDEALAEGVAPRSRRPAEGSA
jgi:cell division protein ZapA